MKNIFEIYREKQQISTESAVQRLNEATTVQEMLSILEEYSYYVLEGIAIRIGLKVPQMPIREELMTILREAVMLSAKTA